MNFQDIVTHDIRLSILLILLKGGTYSHNEFVIRQALALPVFAHQISSDRLRTELAWLAEQSLVERDGSDEVWSAKLTRRGRDVAEGLTEVPGVKRPDPGH